jgi:hypothetical protein
VGTLGQTGFLAVEFDIVPTWRRFCNPRGQWRAPRLPLKHFGAEMSEQGPLLAGNLTDGFPETDHSSAKFPHIHGSIESKLIQLSPFPKAFLYSLDAIVRRRIRGGHSAFRSLVGLFPLIGPRQGCPCR